MKDVKEMSAHELVREMSEGYALDAFKEAVARHEQILDRISAGELRDSDMVDLGELWRAIGGYLKQLGRYDAHDRYMLAHIRVAVAELLLDFTEEEAQEICRESIIPDYLMGGTGSLHQLGELDMCETTIAQMNEQEVEFVESVVTSLSYDQRYTKEQREYIQRVWDAMGR